jgi:putative two-component system hydrogenase maturation factor HypX/HoxX
MSGHHPRRQEAHRLRDLRHGDARRATRSARAWCPRRALAPRITSTAAALRRRRADAHPAAGACLQQPGATPLCRAGRDGHELSVELDIHERVTCEAVDLFRPDVILAPFLKRAIPPSSGSAISVSSCIPGRPATAGPARWTGRFCAGWTLGRHRPAGGGGNRRGAGLGQCIVSDARRTQEQSVSHEVTEGAVAPCARRSPGRGGLGPLADSRQVRAWLATAAAASAARDRLDRDDTATCCARSIPPTAFRASRTGLFDRRFRLFDAHPETMPRRQPGAFIARRTAPFAAPPAMAPYGSASCSPSKGGRRSFKRPAVLALGALADDLPDGDPTGISRGGRDTLRGARRGRVPAF